MFFLIVVFGYRCDDSIGIGCSTTSYSLPTKASCVMSSLYHIHANTSEFVSVICYGQTNESGLPRVEVTLSIAVVSFSIGNMMFLFAVLHISDLQLLCVLPIFGVLGKGYRNDMQ